MGDEGPPKKKSRFFSGGKSLIGNIQTTFRSRHTNTSEQALKKEETSFGAASATFSKSKETENDTEDGAGDELQGDDEDDGGDADTQPAQVSTATAALQNFSFKRHAARRQGLGPDAFKELTSKALQPTPAAPSQDNNAAVGASGTNPKLRMMFSANVPSSRRPLTPPAGPSAPGNQYEEERQKPLHQNLLPQWPSPSSSHNPSRSLVFPNLSPDDQNPTVSHNEDPSKPIRNGHHLGQSVLPHPKNPTGEQRGSIQPLAHLITNIPNAGISNLPFHATLTPARRAHANAAILNRPLSTLTPTFWTSPERVQKAAAASRKRKRAGLVLPPPAYIYTRTNSPDFNIFPAILLYPELCFHLSTHLPLESLVSLYAISRDFHIILDSRFTTVILSQALAKAPECSRVFPFRCYAHLCRKDPASRIPHPDPQKATKGISRAVPSFRWLRMVLWREKVVHEIMVIMAEDGVPLPSRCSMALKRMWFILDIPDNARRIGYIHSNTLVPDLDLYFMACFFVKLDMRFNDPCAQNVYHGLRKLVLAHHSLTYLLRVLKRQELRSQYEVLQAWTRFRYVPLPDEGGMSIFGVAANDVGKGRLEYWGKKTPGEVGRELQVLLRPEQLVMREAVRRGMLFQKHFLRCMLYGYIRPDTLENYAPRELSRRDPRLRDEYGVDDEVGGEEMPGEGDGGDPLLDLGERKEVSTLCVKVDKGAGKAEQVERKKREEEFLELCMKWCRDERQWDSMDTEE